MLPHASWVLNGFNKAGGSVLLEDSSEPHVCAGVMGV